MKTFMEWLEGKLNELNLTPIQMRGAIGNVVGATQVNDPNVVAKSIVTGPDKQLVGALASNDTLRQIGDKLTAAKNKNQPNKTINTNIVAGALGTPGGMV